MDVDNQYLHHFVPTVTVASHPVGMDLVQLTSTFLPNLVFKGGKEYCVVIAVKDMLCCDPDLSCMNVTINMEWLYSCHQLVPVLIVLTLMAVFHIKITDGSLFGFVLFNQLETLQFPGHGYSALSRIPAEISQVLFEYTSHCV